MEKMIVLLLALSTANVFADTFKFKCTDQKTKEVVTLKIQDSWAFGSYIQLDDGYKWDITTQPATHTVKELPAGKYEISSDFFDTGRLYLQDSLLKGKSGFFAEAQRVQGEWYFDVYSCKR